MYRYELAGDEEVFVETVPLTRVFIEDLSPDSGYAFRVQALTGDGSQYGPYSEAISVRTKEEN